jgi:hypothetical protein
MWFKTEKSLETAEENKKRIEIEVTATTSMPQPYTGL